VEPGGALGNDALLRGVLPRQARAYFEWADEVAQARTEKLEKFEAEIDWTQGGTRYGRPPLEGDPLSALCSANGPTGPSSRSSSAQALSERSAPGWSKRCNDRSAKRSSSLLWCDEG
jgi:hypothetical protein